MKLSREKLEFLKTKANLIRKHIIEMIASASSGHPGGSLSVCEIITALYFHIMKYKADEPEWLLRDRFLLSKGHAAPALYAVLAEAGFFPVKYLKTLRQIGSSLQGHPDRLSLPGIEMSAGSLGQGLSIANGVALALKLDHRKSFVYSLIGCGESQEGMIWEGAMSASHFKLDNIIVFTDYNKQQIDGWNQEVKTLEPLSDKWRAFGWEVFEIDGHDFEQIILTVEKAQTIKEKPKMIIAHTIKGKGVSFMEKNLKFHGAAPSSEETDRALKELEK
jgi:transketolase